MKRYVYQREVMAKPSTKEDAERELGTRINNLFFGNNGYIVLDPDTGDASWVTKSLFEAAARPIQTFPDKFTRMLEEAKDMKAELKLLNKTVKPSMGMRRRIYMVTRRLNALTIDFESLIEMAKQEINENEEESKGNG